MRTQRGFGLVQVLVATAVAGILMGAITSAIFFMSSELKSSTAKLNLIGLTDTLRRDLGVAALCKTMITGATIKAGQDNSIALKLVNNPTVLEAKKPATEYDLYISDVVLENPIQTSTAPNGRPIYRTELVLKTSVYSGETAGQPAKGRIFKPARIASLFVEADAAGAVIECSGIGGGGAGSCDISKLGDDPWNPGKKYAGEVPSGTTARQIFNSDGPNNADYCRVVCINAQWVTLDCYAGVTRDNGN